jgi:predicted esterase
MIRSGWLAVCAAFAVLAIAATWASAARLVLKDGRVLQGKLAPTPGLAETLKAPDPDGVGELKLIWFVDDEIRRTYVSKRQIQNVVQGDVGEVLEKFRLRQPTKRTGKTIASVGPVLRVDPFDEYGRRLFTMLTAKGPVDVIEAITEITPVWTKVEGISHVRDMRMATSSIPPDTLDKILRRQIDPDNPDHRKKIAGFYLQAERYEQAAAELESILRAFPNDPDLPEQLNRLILKIKQLGAERLLRELDLRRDAGQHALVWSQLQNFPSADVAGEILQEVRETIREYEARREQGKGILDRIDQLLAEVSDEDTRDRIRPVRDEMFRELNVNTLGRMAAFRQLAGDESLLAEEKLALAISGWLVGSDSATPKLPVALSLYEVRRLVRDYLNTAEKLSRAQILDELGSQEGATPAMVAKLIAHMKPPVETPPPPESTPGFFELEVPALGPGPPVPYLVQLPPEYDPYRHYPAILTLHGAGTTPAHQISWWAGDWSGGTRLGQATRHGYIVVAPKWAPDHQKKYGYTAGEHAAALDVLRDACRRFSIDTDRVFLSGHSMGGDAVWDLGLSHPDLWAGVIPIVAQSDRYCAKYWGNAKPVPYYFVCGELDGTKMKVNARDLDRYLRLGYNATVVEYIGRGHEHFSDEIQRLFDWMGRFSRDFYPREFEVSTMRTWDNFFWWLELSNLPAKAMIDPIDWPPPRGVRPVSTEGKLTATGGIYVSTGAGQATVWLSPEIISFDRRMSIVVNGQRINTTNPPVEPDLETLLEDVRLRGDRQHPFWAKVQTSTGRAYARRSP